MNTINAGASFLEGLASFVSPCTLAVLPVFLAYFSSGKTGDASKPKTFLRVLSFVLGISFAIVLLALAASAFGKFFEDYKGIIQLTGGILIVVLGLMQLDIIRIQLPWNSEAITGKITSKPSGILTSFLFGFFYSFSFTPCVGPVLTSIVILAAQEPKGYLYLIFYLVGFIIPFIFLGIFTDKMTSWLKKYKKAFRTVQIVASCVLIAIGIYSFTLGVRTYKALGQTETAASEQYEMDFTLTGYDGKTYKLSDFKGKPIVLNFFTTWCIYCPDEIESFKTLMKEYPDITFIGVMELTDESEETIKNYMEQKQIPYTILLDPSCMIGTKYRVQGYPTTYFIKEDFDFLGYAPGAMGIDNLREVLNQLSSAKGE